MAYENPSQETLIVDKEIDHTPIPITEIVIFWYQNDDSRFILFDTFSTQRVAYLAPSVALACHDHTPT